MTAPGDGGLRERVVAAFRERFGAAPAMVARAPGRVNLIGEHTDYNDGFVLPMAIDRAVWVAFRPRDDRRVAMHSLDFDAPAEFDLDTLDRADAGRAGGWGEYARGVAWAFAEAGLSLDRGWEGVAAGDVPVGAGLSSSAALELAVARALASAGGAAWDAARMARIAQRAENGWVGVNCGIMDQMISAAGQPGHALLIDCRTLALRPVPVPASLAVVILDTATRRGLVDSAYNERRAQCEEAARHFGVPALRDVAAEDFVAGAAGLGDVVRRRARHVVTENARTLEAAELLAAGDGAAAGRLMDESHRSLRDDFEVSRPELDLIVSLARVADGCHGARMTGAGFGGCAVALVEAAAAPSLARDVARLYAARTGLQPAAYVCRPTAGASVEEA